MLTTTWLFRFKDKLRVVGDLDGKKFKSPKELIGGGDVEWKYTFQYSYKIFSWKFLEEKTLKLSLMRSKTLPYGKVIILYYMPCSHTTLQARFPLTCTPWPLDQWNTTCPLKMYVFVTKHASTSHYGD
jgi:hypothetical protein